jgi:FixJ family two-component response regulator
MSEPLVCVVDDDESARRGVARLLVATGYRVETFAAPADFIARAPSLRASCLVLDLRMPGMSGLEVQDQLIAGRHDVPIVFITGHGDVPSSVRAMKGGAFDFLLKPFQGDELLRAVAMAVERGREAGVRRSEHDAVAERCETLTPREREVFSLVVEGLLNKQVAARLGTSEKTVKAHRARVMEKMAAGSFADLVRMAELLRPGAPRSGDPQ